LFAGALAVVWAGSRFTTFSRTALFWTAFILTRPLGAVVGDFLDKPLAAGGMALSRYSASLTLTLLIVPDPDATYRDAALAITTATSHPLSPGALTAYFIQARGLSAA